MSEQRELMIQDLREIQKLPITKGRALHAANSTCAYLILTSGLPECERRALAGVMRAGSAVEAGSGTAYHERFRERVAGLLEVMG